MLSPSAPPTLPHPYNKPSLIRTHPAISHPPSHPGQNSTLPSLHPKVTDLLITATTLTSLTLTANLALTNPTNYSASVPYINIHLFANDTLLGNATARNLTLVPGLNSNIAVTALWSPYDSNENGEGGAAVGREFLSQYISGWNTSLVLKAHEGSIPASPGLGRALSAFEFTLPTPRLGGDDSPSPPPPKPGAPDEEQPPTFISDATMHLFSSTAEFTLHSPLRHTNLLVTHLNATAFWHRSPEADAEEVGRILYDPVPAMVVPPGESRSPRLPVEWDLGGVGYEAVKRALGGTLKLEARATVGVGIGRWRERVWFVGRGLGVGVRL